MGDYDVLPPTSELYDRALSEFWNYVLATPPDRRDQTQPGNVFFIRAHKLKDGLPVCRIGSDGVIVRKNQKVFIPVMVSVADSQNSNAPTKRERQQKVRLENDKSEPPNEMTVTIDGESLFEGNPFDYYVETNDDFTLTVPKDSPYMDPDVSDLDEVYSYSGDFPAIANGYAVVIHNMRPRDSGPYRLIIDARGKGGYVAQSFYDITVVEDGEEHSRLLSLGKTFEDTLRTRSINLSEADKQSWDGYVKEAEKSRLENVEKRLSKVRNTLGSKFLRPSNKKK